jgi:hypothetical protein
MADEIYTLGLWRVRPGQQERFFVAKVDLRKEHIR